MEDDRAGQTCQRSIGDRYLTISPTEWDKIGADTCQKLIESMPRRFDAVIRAKGSYTKYQIISLLVQ